MIAARATAFGEDIWSKKKTGAVAPPFFLLQISPPEAS